MNGPIGKQMVDTLVESSSNVEVSGTNIRPQFIGRAFIWSSQVTVSWNPEMIFRNIHAKSG